MTSLSPLKLAPEQVNILLDFVENNKHLAFGRTSQDNDSQYEHCFKWKELAREINALDMGHPRAGLEYKECWKELKSKVYGKVYRARNRAKTTKQPVKLSLQEYEWRIYNIMSGQPIDRLLILQIGNNNTPNKQIGPETSFVEQENVAAKQKKEILQNLDDLTTAMHSLARSQAGLAQTQISIIRSLKELAQLIKDT